jgi:hypothetical protein
MYVRVLGGDKTVKDESLGTDEPDRPNKGCGDGLMDGLLHPLHTCYVCVLCIYIRTIDG